MNLSMVTIVVRYPPGGTQVCLSWLISSPLTTYEYNIKVLVKHFMVLLSFAWKHTLIEAKVFNIQTHHKSDCFKIYYIKFEWFHLWRHFTSTTFVGKTILQSSKQIFTPERFLNADNLTETCMQFTVPSMASLASLAVSLPSNMTLALHPPVIREMLRTLP
jgi:hypothetical protein